MLVIGHDFFNQKRIIWVNNTSLLLDGIFNHSILLYQWLSISNGFNYHLVALSSWLMLKKMVLSCWFMLRVDICCFKGMVMMSWLLVILLPLSRSTIMMAVISLFWSIVILLSISTTTIATIWITFIDSLIMRVAVMIIKVIVVFFIAVFSSFLLLYFLGTFLSDFLEIGLIYPSF